MPIRARLLPPLLACLALIAACGGEPADEAPDTAAASAVDRFSSPAPGSVNMYWVTGPDGLIVVDALRTIPDAEKAVEQIRATGLPVTAIVLTHAHPDHVGGLGVLHEAFPDAPVYAADTTADTMAADSVNLYAHARDALGDDFPDEITAPDQILGDGDTVHAAGLTWETMRFGNGETYSSTVYYEPGSKALFAADLVGNAVTPAFREGRTCDWILNLDALAEAYPDAATLYPGHGEPGDPATLIAAQRDYLVFVRETVHDAFDPESPLGAGVSREEADDLLEEIEDAYPEYRPASTEPDLPRQNLLAVIDELSIENATNTPPECLLTD